MVRPHVPLCCVNNPIIAAQHQIDVKLIHSSCELTGEAQRLHPATTYFAPFFFSLHKHTHNISDKSGGQSEGPICCSCLIMTDWLNQGLKKTTASSQKEEFVILVINLDLVCKLTMTIWISSFLRLLQLLLGLWDQKYPNSSLWCF